MIAHFPFPTLEYNASQDEIRYRLVGRSLMHNHATILTFVPLSDGEMKRAAAKIG